ncbi:hypothetical protein M5K25_003331 [Dendrobium thyrsiflorum]|uniref:Uncharacterized protein n=1 Tax=Dendrobium thyrsiflorum TaxID=117978 RepID=A0ABD0VJX4_DENTH
MVNRKRRKENNWLLLLSFMIAKGNAKFRPTQEAGKSKIRGRPPPTSHPRDFLKELFPLKKSLQEERKAFIYIVSTKQDQCMADPDLDSGIVYDEQGFIHILHSTFFDVNLRIDHTVEEYMECILNTLAKAIKELGNVQWHIVSCSH